MDPMMRRLFGNVLVFESNWFIGNLWKSYFVRAVPHGRIKITGSEDDMTRELKNGREHYSFIIINRSPSLYRIFSKIKNHPRYRDVPVCVYSEEEAMDPLARNYLRESTHVLIVQTLNPPYGILEKIRSIFTSREESPMAREAKFQAVLYFMQEKNYAQALLHLNRVPDLPKLILRKTILKLGCYAEMGRYQEALELLMMLEDYKILSPGILSLGVLIHERCGHPEEAQRLAELLIQHFPGTSETLLAQVDLLKRNANIEEIKRILLDHFEDHSLARERCFQTLVSLCLEKKQYDQLIGIARWSDLRFSRSTGEQITQHALELHESGRTDLAIEIFDALHGLYTDPDRWIPLYNLGQLQSAQGRFSQAVESLSLSLMVNPQSVEIVQALMTLLPRARKDKRSVNPAKLKNAIRRRIMYLNRRMDIRLLATEENAFKIYSVETPRLESSGGSETPAA